MDVPNKSIEDMLAELDDSSSVTPDSLPSNTEGNGTDTREEGQETSSLDLLAATLGIDLSDAQPPSDEPVVDEPPVEKPKRSRAKKVVSDEELAQKEAEKEAKAKAKAEAQAKKKADAEAKKLAKAEEKARKEAEKEQAKADTAEEVETESKPKVQKAPFKMDAPIPVTKFRDLTIGFYGNILEPLDGPDKEGFVWAEVPKTKYHPSEHESYRGKGRTVLVINQDSKRYLVGVEQEGSFEGVIEVTNRGRGALRCRQLAQALGLAYMEKADEIKVSDTEYQAYLEKTKQPVAPEIPVKIESVS